MRLRRSRLLPRVLWLATRAVAHRSPALAGRLAAGLWFVPWQRATAPVPLPAGARRSRLVVAGSEVDVLEAGDGPTVLLVHGWADRAASLAPLAAALAEAGWRTVAVDLPAHGDTPGRSTDLLELAAVVGDLAVRFDARAVVAHSLGAAAAARALRDGHHGVERLVLLAPAVRLETAVRVFVEELRLPPSVADALGRRIEHRFGPDVWTDVATDANLADSGISGTVIHDERDRRAPVAGSRELVAAWPGSRLHTTSGLGHSRLLADPGVVAHVVAAVSADGTGEPARTPEPHAEAS